MDRTLNSMQSVLNEARLNKNGVELEQVSVYKDKAMGFLVIEMFNFGSREERQLFLTKENVVALKNYLNRLTDEQIESICVDDDI